MILSPLMLARWAEVSSEHIRNSWVFLPLEVKVSSFESDSTCSAAAVKSADRANVSILISALFVELSKRFNIHVNSNWSETWQMLFNNDSIKNVLNDISLKLHNIHITSVKLTLC